MKLFVGAIRFVLVVVERVFNALYRHLPTQRSRRVARRSVAVVQRTFTRIEGLTYRRFGWTVGGPLAEAQVLLLTTTGRRSELPRTTPLVYVTDGDTLLVVGAYGGLPWHPDWYLNLLTDPTASVAVNGVQIRVDAVVVAGPERSALWSTMLANVATLADSANLAAPREIPLVRLTPREP